MPKAGLGLYVVRKLCKEMDWSFSAHNQLQGGTAFVLEVQDLAACSLPAAKAGDKANRKRKGNATATANSA
ncbi:MAG: ATP-binding protein [Limnobacter sp.]|nr:ATP-binding protein [Limnobacter sp.]